MMYVTFILSWRLLACIPHQLSVHGLLGVQLSVGTAQVSGCTCAPCEHRIQV